MSHSRLLSRATATVGVVALALAGFVGLTSLGSPSAHAETGTGGTHAHATNSTTGLSTSSSTDIHIVGGGWNDGEQIAALECRANPPDQSYCDISTVQIGTGPDIDLTVPVHGGDVGKAECPPDDCVIQVASVSRQADAAVFIPISFGAPGTGSELSADLAMPSQIPDDGTGAPQTPVTVTLDNSGNGPLNNIETDLTLTLPDNLSCSDVTLDKTGSAPSPGTPSGTSKCTYNLNKSGLNGDEKDTYTYDFAVDGTSASAPPVTGTVSGELKVVQQDEDGNYVSTLATASDSSEMTAPSAPSFKAAPTNGATIYRSYSYDLVKDTGLPPTPADPSMRPSQDAGYGAFGSHQNADGSYDYIGQAPSCATTDGKKTCAITLEGHGYGGNFQFNTTTGKIESVKAPSDINTDPYWTWTIIANNGEGGAGPNDVTNGPSNGKPQVLRHDVFSDPFTLPVLFHDVHQNSPFASEIYSLANADVIKGYGDGNFKATNAITRQAFVTFEMRVYNAITGSDGYTGPRSPYGNGTNENGTGACDARSGESSGFSDVSVNSRFCEQIRDLTRAGVIQGYDDGTFKPAKHVSRQAIAAFLFRLDSYLKGAQVGDAECTTPTGYNDITTANPFCGDIEWLTHYKIASGYGDGGFHPDGDTTRQAGAAFFYRFGNHEVSGTFTDPFSS